MIKIIFSFQLIFLIATSSYSFAATAVRLINVHDGDSITVTLKSGKREKIRFFGIDAPEINQPFGKESRRHLESLLKNKMITYSADSRDQYGRLTATVYADNEDINLKMIHDGYAWHYKSYSNSKEFANAQKHAKKNKLGLWRDANPIAPWKFRQNKRSEATRNDPLIKSPISDFYFCVSLKTFKYLISKDACPKGYVIVIGE